MEINLSQILFQILNFSIVLFVLNKFLYKPLVKILKQRQEKVAAGLKAAESNLKTQAELEDAKKEALTQARKEAAEIITQAKKDAKKEAQTVLEQAQSQAEKVLAKERQAIQATLDNEREDLENQFGKLVAQTTEALLKNYLSKTEQQKIIDAQIKELKDFSFS